MTPSLAPLLQLASATLPVGGFTYSRGLETAVSRGLVCDLETTARWIGGLLDSASRLDAPLVARAYRATSAGERREAGRWAILAQATRETRELAAESKVMGRALARLAVDLGLAQVDEVDELREAFVTMFGFVAARLALSEEEAVHGYLWSWLEASVTAAVKLVPLGQTDGQRLLLRFGAELGAHVARSRALPDDEVGALNPGLAILSSWHETEHTRLFRS